MHIPFPDIRHALKKPSAESRHLEQLLQNGRVSEAINPILAPDDVL
jgi:hypothetical protein